MGGVEDYLGPYSKGPLEVFEDVFRRFYMVKLLLFSVQQNYTTLLDTIRYDLKLHPNDLLIK